MNTQAIKTVLKSRAEKANAAEDFGTEAVFTEALRAIKETEASEARLREALTKLMCITGDIEVLGEWEALDMNYNLRRTTRAKVDAVIAEARAALAPVAGAHPAEQK